MLIWSMYRPLLYNIISVIAVTDTLASLCAPSLCEIYNLKSVLCMHWVWRRWIESRGDLLPHEFCTCAREETLSGYWQGFWTLLVIYIGSWCLLTLKHCHSTWKLTARYAFSTHQLIRVAFVQSLHRIQTSAKKSGIIGQDIQAEKVMALQILHMSNSRNSFQRWLGLQVFRTSKASTSILKTMLGRAVWGTWLSSSIIPLQRIWVQPPCVVKLSSETGPET